MLKYIKDSMTTIDGIEIYPIISLSIFFLFFVVLLVHVVRVNKSMIEEMEQYPLD